MDIIRHPLFIFLLVILCTVYLSEGDLKCFIDYVGLFDSHGTFDFELSDGLLILKYLLLPVS